MYKSLLEIRVSLNMTQVEFAKKVKMTQGAISAIERNHHTPHLSTKERINRFLRKIKCKYLLQ